MCGKCKLWSFKKIRPIETEIVEYVSFLQVKLFYLLTERNKTYIFIQAVWKVQGMTFYEIQSNLNPR